MEIDFYPSHKQDLMFDYFDDKQTTEILWGGSAGGGKSYGICALMIIKALQKPGIRIGLARNELTTLKKTTIISFFEVLNNWGIADKVQYNSTGGIIKFQNGSEIILIELRYLPSDPLYTRLGGQLLTFGVIDEVTEVDERGFSIFQTRLGRWKNDELYMKAICLMTCNPAKNWVYKRYYRPYVDGTLKPNQVFIPALATDNPFISEKYIEKLKDLPNADRQRMLYGNWDYDESPNALLKYEEILNIFDNIGEPLNKHKYISCDIAFTSDKMVILIWDGYLITDIIVNPEGKIEDVINQLGKEHNVPEYNITYDSDGVGKFLGTRLRNAKPIVNNARALNNENYQNLKTQLYFKLCDKIKDNSIKIASSKYSELITEELSAIEHKPVDTVGKLQMNDKGEVKKKIGRSPDFSDAMAYRMYFEFKNLGGARRFKII